tara:strand:- start:25 stop:828 length:804 start_codon:yes stop_codon:yes gene_type:complete
MKIGVDFGITNTDIAINDRKQFTYLSFPSIEIQEDLSKIVKKLSSASINLAECKSINVTGGKSSELPNTYNKIKINHINEIDAIGTGAKQIYELNDPSLIVSAGTGTALVAVKDSEIVHLGGIAVGGGMLEGLGHVLFNNSNGYEINEFANKGDRSKVDLLIGDVVNKIGNLGADETAVNFGQSKSSDLNTMENLSSSVCNMVGEVIGTMAYLNAFLIKTNQVFFIGRTSLLSNVQAGINTRLRLAGIEGKYAKDREYCNAVGASLF